MRNVEHHESKRDGLVYVNKSCGQLSKLTFLSVNDTNTHRSRRIGTHAYFCKPSHVALCAENNVSTRTEFITQSVATIAATFAFLPGQANAAKYGGFGSGSPEVIDPKDAVVDSDILSSSSVQKGISAVRAYKQSVVDMKASLASDSQADIGPKIRKDFDFSVIRTDLNAINAALDEDTQRGTDRIVRAILQDITELEVAQKQKPGVARSETRLSNVTRKLDKLEKSFDDYLAFAT